MTGADDDAGCEAISAYVPFSLFDVRAGPSVGGEAEEEEDLGLEDLAWSLTFA